MFLFPLSLNKCIRNWKSCNCHLSIQVWDAWILLSRPLSDQRFVFEYSCGSSSGSGPHVCMHEEQLCSTGVEPCHGIYRYERRGLPTEALLLFVQRSTHLVLSDPVHFKGPASSWQDSSGSLGTVSLGEYPVPLPCLQNAHRRSWESYWIVHVVNGINNSKLLANIIQQLWFWFMLAGLIAYWMKSSPNKPGGRISMISWFHDFKPVWFFSLIVI